MNALVFGSSGQLACHLRSELESAMFWGRAQCDLDTLRPIDEAVIAAAPSVIVNAAAFTAVDRAESEPELAWRINAAAPAAMARAAAILDIPLIHISSDYVFDGSRQHAYSEHDATAPLSVYGKTKLAGELAVATLSPKHWILRTSWVFSEFGANFVKTMIRLARERESLHVVADQYGVPTYAGDIARVVAKLISSLTGPSIPWGTYHVTGGPAVSWHQFAETITSVAYRSGLLTRKPVVHAISTAEYPTAARRPPSSILAPSSMLSATLAMQPYWPTALEVALAKLRLMETAS